MQHLKINPRDIFRFNPHFRLMTLEELPSEKCNVLGKIDPGDFFGVVKRRDGTGIDRIVGRDAALLIYMLDEPGPLPSYLTRASNATMLETEVIQLVLDDVLELQEGNRFISGMAALGRWQQSDLSNAQLSGMGYLSTLSREAVRSAARFAGAVSTASLMAELYTYHRLPMTPRQAQGWGGAERIAERLDFHAGGRLSQTLKREWRIKTQIGPFDWMHWTRRRVSLPASEEATYKLYVSPLPDALPETFSRLVDALPETEAFCFKVASDAAAVLRPDKLVVYFSDFESLYRAARLLEKRLQGLPVHGVPLTCEVGLDGLLSWGLDPPLDFSAGGSQRESWRMWLANRLATVLAIAAERPCRDMPLWQQALERLRFEGIDVDTWKPSLSQWRAPVEEICS